MAYIRNKKEDQRIRKRMRQILMNEMYGSDLHMSRMHGGKPSKKRKPRASKKVSDKFRRMEKKDKNKKPIKKQRKPNAWLIFYRNWLKEHPEHKGKFAIKIAAMDYNLHKQKKMKKGSALIYESDYFSDYDEYD